MISTYGLKEPGNLANAQPRIVGALSGGMSTINGGADVWALQNDSSTKVLSVDKIRASAITATAFSSAQPLLFSFFKVAGFTVIQSTGTGIKTISVQSKDSRAADASRAISGVNCRISGSAAIGSATYTSPDADEPLFTMVCPTSTTPSGTMEWEASAYQFPIQLREHEGLICRPGITMGATGVMNLHISVEFTNQ